MDEEFDIENEVFYAVNGEFDCSSNDSHSYFYDYIEKSLKEPTLKSMHQKIPSKSSKSTDLLSPEQNFQEKCQIQFNENPLERISIHNDKIKVFDIDPQKKYNQMMSFQKNQKKDQNLICQNNYCFPNIGLTNIKDSKVYQMLFKVTGAYLTQNELSCLRKTIFKNIMPLMTRDEQRSKMKNIERFEKYHDKIIPILQNPKAQSMIQNYLLNRRRDYEKMEMLANLYKNYQRVTKLPDLSV